MVEPKTCKTSLVVLSFSSYENFVFFRDRLQWKITNLFPSERTNENRRLILFLDKLNSNNRPFDQDQLIKLGNNLDSYILYIKTIENSNFYNGLIHYDSANPQWNIIQVKFRCRQWNAFDRYPCSPEILPVTLFHPQRPSSSIQSINNIHNQTNSSLSLLMDISSTKSIQKQRKSTDFLLLIIIPSIVLFLTIIILIVIYLCITKKYCFQREINSTYPSISQITIENPPINRRRMSISTISDQTIVPNIDHHHYRVPITNRLAKDLDNNYEKVNLDRISLVREQRFVPISSSIHF